MMALLTARRVATRALPVVLAAMLGLPLAAGAAERLFVNGHVFTANRTQPYAAAVAVRDGTIVAVGTDDEARRAVGSSAEVIDLHGGTLLPGLIDSHVHTVDGGLSLLGVDVQNEVADIDRLAAIAADAGRSGRGLRGDVVRISGLPIEVWSHLPELNRAIAAGPLATKPVLLLCSDGHTGWANPVLLKRAGITPRYLRSLPEARRKYYGYDASFTPNGFLVDAGLDVALAVLPEPAAATYKAAAAGAIDYLHGFGITSWLEASITVPMLDAYRALAAEHRLTAHVAAFIDVHAERPDPLAEVLKLREEYRDVPGLTLPGVKVYADGVVEYPAQTAAMWAPYAITLKTGDLLFRPEDFARLCIAADRLGLIVHTHAIGDRAVTETLNGIEAARRANGPNGPRHSITHLQFIRPSDQPRFAALGVYASYQLLWAEAGTDTIDLVKPYVDPAIYPWQYPARSLLDQGAVIAGASDWNVSSPNPFLAIYQAETRRGALGVLDAAQAVPREAMLYAYTINAARVMQADALVGSIEPGKAADLVLVDRDVLTVPAESLRETKVLWTVVNGEWVYRAP